MTTNLAATYPPATGCPTWLEGERRIWRKRRATTPSEWNTRHRVVTAGPRPGPWRKETVAYIPEVMDTLDLRHVERVAFCAPPQSGKSEASQGFLAKRADHNPGPAMVVLPDQNLTKRISGNRYIPMFNQSPRLADLTTGNPDDLTMLEIHLKNGFDLYLSWASSPAMLAQISIEVLIREEIDKYIDICGKETDPMDLSFVRTNAYRRTRKIMDISTTTLEDGPIWTALNSCDEIRDYWVACPLCGAMQLMTFDQLKWPEEEKDHARIKDRQLAWYECADCHGPWDDYRRDQAVRAGCWVPRIRRDKPASVGFHLAAWCSPFVSLSECAAAHVKAKPNREGKVKDRRAWITFLNQYASLPHKDEESDLPDWEKIKQRAENYGARIPMRAAVLTAYADVQDDRLEVEVVAWGVDEESWSIDHHIITGVPSSPMVWRALDEYLCRRWLHESGVELRIAAAGVDTGGHFTKQAYDFVRKKYHRRIYGTKGASQRNKPLVSRPTRTNLGKIPLFLIGTDTAKETIFSRLSADKGDAGYMHFPTRHDDEYYKQLVSEKPKITYVSGRPVREWVKIRERNEVLDLWVGNMAILAILNPNLRKLVRDLQIQAGNSAQESFDLTADEDGDQEVNADTIEGVVEEGAEETEAVEPLPMAPEAPDPPLPTKARTKVRKRRTGGWVNGWKN